MTTLEALLMSTKSAVIVRWTSHCLRSYSWDRIDRSITIDEVFAEHYFAAVYPEVTQIVRGLWLSTSDFSELSIDIANVMSCIQSIFIR